MIAATASDSAGLFAVQKDARSFGGLEGFDAEGRGHPGVELFAGEDVQVGGAAGVGKVAADVAGFDQLHQ